MKGGRNLLWVLPAVLIISGPLWWNLVADFLRPRGGEIGSKTPVTDMAKTFSLEEMILTQSRGNNKEMRLQSERVYTADGDKILHLEKVDAELYDKTGDRIHVVSGSGQLQTEEQQLTLKENVRLNADQGYIMHTEVLTYMAREKKLQSDEVVTLAGNNIQVKGKGMSYDVESGALQLGGRVHVDLW